MPPATRKRLAPDLLGIVKTLEALMRGPQSAEDLVEETGINQTTVHRWIRHGRAIGLLHNLRYSGDGLVQVG